MSKENITRVTLDDILRKRARGEKSLTDHARVDAMTDEDIERAMRDDPDWADLIDMDWSTAEIVEPVIKKALSIRLDQERLDMRVRSQPKHLTIAALPTDLLVTGTLRDPVITPEIVELGIRGGIAAALGFASVPLAILPTIELGIGDDTRCNDTLRRAQGGRRGAEPR